MKPSEVKSIRLQTRVSQNDINRLGGRDNVLKLLKQIRFNKTIRKTKSKL